MDRSITLTFKQALAIVSFFLSTFTPAIYYFSQKKTEQRLSTVRLQEQIIELRKRQDRLHFEQKAQIDELISSKNVEMSKIVQLLNEIILRANYERRQRGKDD